VIFHVTYTQEVKIVAPYEKGLEPCTLICAGTTGIGTTAWKTYYGDHIHVSVDMSECGFVSAPIVSTVVTGEGMTRILTGTGGIYNLKKKSFSVFPTTTYDYDLLMLADEFNWRVDWQAIGFIC
jgi:hypothetical protein